jgi:hypothetical protein
MGVLSPYAGPGWGRVAAQVISEAINILTLKVHSFMLI